MTESVNFGPGSLQRLQNALAAELGKNMEAEDPTVCHWCHQDCGGTCLGLTDSTQMKIEDPAYFLLADGQTTTPSVHRAGCYICEDPEFAQMGLPLCRPCPRCSEEHRVEHPEMDDHTAGHIPADDEECSDCGYNVREAYDREQAEKEVG